ncbi:MAG: hypothetical protein HYZ38_19875 [Mycobacterium sp.]|nr:hypothetical protein [Mycobacterium sp.]
MLSRALIGAVCAAASIATPAMAWADPEPTPAPVPPPNVNSFAMAKPADYIVNDGIYGFTSPSGLTCIISRGTGYYGCSGPMPGAPGGANVVTGGPSGEPGFSTSDAPLYPFTTPPKPLPANTRLSYSTVSCGVDGGGGVVCSNSFDQTGFVAGPGGSFSFGAVNPLLDRPDGTNPFMN